MAVCLLDKSLTKSNQCGYSLPQIVRLFLANYDEVSGTTLTENGYEVASITMKTAGESTGQWYEVDPAQNSASYSDTLGVGGNGNKYRIHTVGFSYSSAYDSGLAKTIDELSLGKYIAVAKMLDESYIMLGRVAGLEAAADGVNNTGSGDATAEAGLVVTLTGNALEPGLPLSAAAISTVTGVAGA